MPSDDKKVLEDSASVVSSPWRESRYYADAEQWTHVFWNESSLFRRLFGRLDLRTVVELASGHGRHAERCVAACGSLTLVDVFESNLQYCRDRLSRYANVRYLLGNGYDFSGIESGHTTAIYCYDAMVHFSPDLVESYLKDAGRVLMPGGMILLHHSNHPTPPGVVHYGQNPHARNHMTYELFRQLADKAQLTVVESQPVVWGGIPDLDRVSLLVRPA